MLLPGQQAARVRRQAAELLCRYLGGDLALVDEVCRHSHLAMKLMNEESFQETADYENLGVN